MFIHKKVILFLLILIFVAKGFSQENNYTTKTKLPSSLYITQLSFFDATSNINKKLDLTSFKFVILNKKDIEDGFFTFSLKNLKRTSTSYIYDDYKYVYLDRYIFKGYDLRKLPEIRNISSK